MRRRDPIGRAARMARRVAHEVAWALAPGRADERLGSAPRGWLFVVGVNNSGTTLLAKLLGAHPAIAALPTEGQYLTNALPRPERYRARRLWTERGSVFRAVGADDLDADARRARHDWGRYWQGLEGARWLMEKSPPSCLRTRLLQANFAPATFVVLTRSPYAVCEGIVRRQGVSVARAAAHWDRAHRALLEDLPRLERARLVRYEALAAEPGRVLGELTAMLGLAPLPEAAWRGPHAVHNAAGEARPIADMNAGSLARLGPEDVEAITGICAETMAQLGYDVVDAARAGGERGGGRVGG